MYLLALCALSVAAFLLLNRDAILSGGFAIKGADGMADPITHTWMSFLLIIIHEFFGKTGAGVWRSSSWWFLAAQIFTAALRLSEII